MALTLKKITDPSPVDQDRVDYNVLSGDWTIGRISEEISGPPEYRWFWALQMNGPDDKIGKRSDRVASFEEAKEQLRTAWERWKKWAELEETSHQ
jgi:hypothetical protein